MDANKINKMGFYLFLFFPFLLTYIIHEGNNYTPHDSSLAYRLNEDRITYYSMQNPIGKGTSVKEPKFCCDAMGSIRALICSHASKTAAP